MQNPGMRAVPAEAAALPTADLDAPIHCPFCAAPMFVAISPGGEDVIECSNPRCQKVCNLEALDYFLSRMPDAEGIAVLTLARPKEHARA